MQERRNTQVWLNPFTFVGYRNSCVFSRKNPYIFGTLRSSADDLISSLGHIPRAHPRTRPCGQPSYMQSTIFSSGIVDRASETRARVKITPREKGETQLIFLSPRRVSPFLAWGDYHAPSRFACSTVPEDEWGTTRSPIQYDPQSIIIRFWVTAQLPLP